MSFSCCFPGFLSGAPKEWIVEIRIPMNGVVRHGRILIKDFLRPVPVVVVNIEDRDPLVSSLLQRPSGDGGIIQVTEPAMQVMRGVVAGRPT